jgi:hypothetical protein
VDDIADELGVSATKRADRLMTWEDGIQHGFSKGKNFIAISKKTNSDLRFFHKGKIENSHFSKMQLKTPNLDINGSNQCNER